MHKRKMQSLAAAFFLFVCSHHESLAATPMTKSGSQIAFEDYVASCKAGAEIDAIPQLDCNDINFRNPNGNPDFSKSTDYVAHTKVTSVVDAVFACRWVHANEGMTIQGFINEGDIVAASGEMIVHNKVSGKTCFFKMRPANTTQPIDGATANQYERIATTKPSSPTDADGFKYWDTPDNVLAEACTQCHAAGPWIASPQIVGALARFGLINDGHDTLNQRYSAIGSNGSKLNQYAQDSVTVGATQFNNCSARCHVKAGAGLRSDDINTTGSSTATGFIIIPSITRVINDVNMGGAMPPNSPHSDYRWVNMDTPGGAGGDWERLKDLNANRPQFACLNGVKEVQMQAVDSGRVISSADFPDVLRAFNLLDGLVCKNADQKDGHTCADYQTRYHCGSGAWTKWRNLSTPSSDGDDESRANFPSMCSNPWEIKAQVVVNGKVKYFGYGPPDRMQEFNTTVGVACRNSVQPSGQCQDYTVRYICEQ